MQMVWGPRPPSGIRTVCCPRTLRVRREGAPEHSRGGCAPLPCLLLRPGSGPASRAGQISRRRRGDTVSRRDGGAPKPQPFGFGGAVSVCARDLARDTSDIYRSIQSD